MAPSLLRRLADGEVLILDGAIGTELQRRGAPMDDAAWCAAATRTHPDLLRQIHQDYISAGADIITTNTYATARHVLTEADLGEETEEINRRAVELARQAIEEAGSETLLAGSMSSMGSLTGPPTRPHGEAIAMSYREQARILADAGVDVVVAEMMCDLDNSPLVIEAARSTGLPVMVGWTASPGPDGGAAPYRSERQQVDPVYSFDELMRLGSDLGGEVAGIMHSDVGITGAALEILARHWEGPRMAYAETGHFEPPYWVFTEAVSPDEYVEAAFRWIADGVQIVGGCCGTTPEHIAALRSAVS